MIKKLKLRIACLGLVFFGHFSLPLHSMQSDHYTADHSTLGVRLIRLIEKQDDINMLIKFCSEHEDYHRKSEEQNYSGLGFADIDNINILKEAKAQSFVNNIFGIYGFYLKENENPEQLVGIIKMLGVYIEGDFEGYAECEITMHPNSRRQRLGYSYCELFHEQTIKPILDKQVNYQNNPITFHGTIVYVHANNIASRYLAKKLGFMPVKLTCNPYLNMGEAMQIIYLYPPLPESKSIPAQLSEDLKNVILANDLQKNTDILINYISTTCPNQSEFVIRYFEFLGAKKLSDTTISDIDWEKEIFIVLIKDSFTNCINIQFRTIPEGQKLLKLAQEVSLFQVSLKLLEEGNVIKTIKDGPLEIFLKRQYEELRYKLNRDLSLS